MDSYIGYLAAKWFQKQARRLGQQLPGIRQGEDMECVHRARVACRRLRAGLGLFGDWPSAKRHRRWEGELRRLGRKLGQARDKDVQLSFLVDHFSQAPSLEVRVGLSGLILWRQTEREAAYRKASKAVARFQNSGLLKQIRSQSGRTLRQAQIPEEELLYYPLWEEAGEKIQMLTQQMSSYAPSLRQIQEQACHHALRIVAKKLRYSLEILASLFGPEIQPTLQSLENFQTLMGQLHDCQVWLLELARFEKDRFLRTVRKQWKKAGLGSGWTVRAFRAAIRWLQQDRQKAQKNLLQEADRFWQQKLQEEITDRLADLVQTALLRPGKLRVLPGRPVAIG